MAEQFIPGKEPKWYRVVYLNIPQNRLRYGFWHRTSYMDQRVVAHHIATMIEQYPSEPFWDIEVSYSEINPNSIWGRNG